MRKGLISVLVLISLGLAAWLPGTAASQPERTEFAGTSHNCGMVEGETWETGNVLHQRDGMHVAELGLNFTDDERVTGTLEVLDFDFDLHTGFGSGNFRAEFIFDPADPGIDGVWMASGGGKFRGFNLVCFNGTAYGTGDLEGLRMSYYGVLAPDLPNACEDGLNGPVWDWGGVIRDFR